MEGTFFQEFVVTCPKPVAEINAHLESRGIVGGLDVGTHFTNGLLFCVTEVSTRDHINRLIEALAEVR